MRCMKKLSLLKSTAVGRRKGRRMVSRKKRRRRKRGWGRRGRTDHISPDGLVGWCCSGM